MSLMLKHELQLIQKFDEECRNVMQFYLTIKNSIEAIESCG